MLPPRVPRYVESTKHVGQRVKIHGISQHDKSSKKGPFDVLDIQAGRRPRSA